MISAAPHALEADRLHCLHLLDVLDTPPDPALDAITAAAALQLDCPIALVSLVDEARQWFKSRHGLAADQTPRSQAFCAHAILDDDGLVVPDALADPRFADNPLVCGAPDLRFYAGVPLRVDGLPMGTLCVIDRRPHQLDAAQHQVLRQLARAAEACLVRDMRLRELALARGRLQDFLQASADLLWECDERLRLTWVSEHARALLGQAPAALRGQPLWDGPLCDGAGEPLGARLHERLADGQPFTQRVLALQLPDRRLALALSGRPVLDAQGRRIGWRGVACDVGARQEAEQQRRAAAASASREREHHAFLSRVSHELRTPLNAVLGFTQLLRGDRGDGLAPHHQRWLGLVHDAGRHLQALIDDVLELGRLRSAPRPLDPAPLQPGPLLEDCLALLQPLAASAGVRLEPPRLDAGDARLRADTRALRQVLTNVIGNAIKYNRADGRVSSRVRHHDAMLAIEVQDQGAGIAPERLDRLFQPFERLGAEHGTVPGTGLGLAIAKGLVEAMGGRIEAHAAPGGGTRIDILLPRAA